MSYLPKIKCNVFIFNSNQYFTTTHTSMATIPEPTTGYSAKSAYSPNAEQILGPTGYGKPIATQFRLEYDILYDFILVLKLHTGMKSFDIDQTLLIRHDLK